MRYPNIDAMWFDAIHALESKGHDSPSRDGDTLEIVGYAAELTDPSFCWLHSPGRNLDPVYAMAEIAWYMSGSTDVAWMSKFAPQYSRFADDGKAYGGYGGRLHRLGIDQLAYVVDMLKTKQHSRQAVVTMWEIQDLPHALVGDKKDLPCTLSLQFILRDGLLHLVATMRSNDVWLGMPYDVFWYCTLQRLVAWELGVDVGSYFHRAGSLHLYDRDAEKADACEPPGVDTLPSWWDGDSSSINNVRETATRLLEGSPIDPVGIVSSSMGILCRGGDIESIDTPLRLAALNRRQRDSSRRP